jgi:hypothetical protein
VPLIKLLTACQLRLSRPRGGHLGAALGVPLIKLFDGVSASGGKAVGRSPAELIAEPNAFRLASAFAEISDVALRRSIVRLVEDSWLRQR